MNEKLKVAVLSSCVFQTSIPRGTIGYAGLEVIAYEVARGLAARGHQVSLVAPQGSSCPGVQMIHTGPPGQWNEDQAFDKIWSNLLAYNDGGVIIDHGWQKHCMLLKQEGRLTCPILNVCHAPIRSMVQSLPPGVDKPCFVCISEDQRTQFEALFDHPARTAYNGIDPEFYKPSGVVRGDRFLFLARFSTIKGPDIALDICLRTGVGLDMVGDTRITNEPEFYDQCVKLSEQTSKGWDVETKGKQIRIIGGVSRVETVHWFSKARGLLHLNQRFKEPFGLSPVEAQSCGCPVLGWDLGAMRETVRHGETGYLVQSVDEAVNVIKTGALDRLDRDKCRAWGSSYSLDRMTSRYEELCIESLTTGGW